MFWLDGKRRINHHKITLQVHEFLIKQIATTIDEHAVDRLNHLFSVFKNILENGPNQKSYNHILNVLSSRTQCRSFDTKPVEEEKVNVLLNVVNKVPSKQNIVPMKVDVLGPDASTCAISICMVQTRKHTIIQR